jgi:hypothetical protein
MINKLNTIVWIIVILLLMGVGGYFLWQTQQETSPFYVNLDQAAVVKEMRELERLETATFTLEKIIEAGKTTTTGTSLEEFFVGDKLLLIAHGQVIAGFDMQNMGENDIQIEGQSITMNLPAPEILVSRLDNEKTQVYDRDQGIFTKGDKDLESEARRNAEIAIRQAACESGILEQARQNGVKQIRSLLQALNFTNVTVNAPEGRCE